MLLENNHKFANIQSQFLCCVPVRKVQWQNTLANLYWDDQKHLLDHTVNLSILERYPLQAKYVIRFLRHIIDTLEQKGDEIHDDLYIIFCEYQTKAKAFDSLSFSYKHYRIETAEGNVETIIIKENHNKISEGTTGLNVWESALALCDWALHNKSFFHGKNVLELGAGTGLTGLVIGKCCQPTTMTLTDGNDKVLEYLNENLRINFDRDEKGRYHRNDTKLDVIDLNWNDAFNENTNCLQHIETPELIIAADIIYDSSLFRSLCQMLDKILLSCANACEFILVNAIRNKNTQTEFFDELSKYQFIAKEENLRPPSKFLWESTDECPIKIYRIYRIVSC